MVEVCLLQHFTQVAGAKLRRKRLFFEIFQIVIVGLAVVMVRCVELFFFNDLFFNHTGARSIRGCRCNRGRLCYRRRRWNGSRFFSLLFAQPEQAEACGRRTIDVVRGGCIGILRLWLSLLDGGGFMPRYFFVLTLFGLFNKLFGRNLDHPFFRPEFARLGILTCVPRVRDFRGFLEFILFQKGLLRFLVNKLMWHRFRRSFSRISGFDFHPLSEEFLLLDYVRRRGAELEVRGRRRIGESPLWLRIHFNLWLRLALAMTG